MDKLLAGLLIIILSPLLVTVIMARFFADGNPVFFVQKRVGRLESVFPLYKFCTLVKSGNENDFVYTRFGYWLRTTSFDELPQLLNVIKGEMSLVGPRPLPVEYLSRFTSTQKSRHLVRPGITGLAQIKGRNDLSWDQRFKYDIEYIRNFDLKTDLQILASTLLVPLSKKGVRPYFQTPPKNR